MKVVVTIKGSKQTMICECHLKTETKLILKTEEPSEITGQQLFEFKKTARAKWYGLVLTHPGGRMIYVTVKEVR